MLLERKPRQNCALWPIYIGFWATSFVDSNSTSSLGKTSIRVISKSIGRWLLCKNPPLKIIFFKSVDSVHCLKNSQRHQGMRWKSTQSGQVQGIFMNINVFNDFTHIYIKLSKNSYYLSFDWQVSVMSNFRIPWWQQNVPL